MTTTEHCNALIVLGEMGTALVTLVIIASAPSIDACTCLCTSARRPALTSYAKSTIESIQPAEGGADIRSVATLSHLKASESFVCTSSEMVGTRLGVTVEQVDSLNHCTIAAWSGLRTNSGGSTSVGSHVGMAPQHDEDLESLTVGCR